jgi:hypothetical protein
VFQVSQFYQLSILNYLQPSIHLLNVFVPLATDRRLFVTLCQDLVPSTKSTTYRTHPLQSSATGEAMWNSLFELTITKQRWTSLLYFSFFEHSLNEFFLGEHGF